MFLKLSIYELDLRSNNLSFKVSSLYRKIPYKHPVLVWAGGELDFSWYLLWDYDLDLCWKPNLLTFVFPILFSHPAGGSE